MTISTNYNEHNIRILKDAEIEAHSVFGKLSLLVQTFPSTAEEHLQRVAECLFELGLPVQVYIDYRNGTVHPDHFTQMDLWFRNRNKKGNK